MDILRDNSISDLKKESVVIEAIIPVVAASCNNHSLDLKIIFSDTFLEAYVHSYLKAVMQSSATISKYLLVAILQLNIVLFRHHGHHVMHRITARDGERLTLAGDGNYRKVEHCTTADVVAMVSCIIDRKGRSTECGSRRWRTASAIWVAMPPLIRRCILGALWRLGVR